MSFSFGRGEGGGFDALGGLWDLRLFWCFFSVLEDGCIGFGVLIAGGR